MLSQLETYRIFPIDFDISSFQDYSFAAHSCPLREIIYFKIVRKAKKMYLQEIFEVYIRVIRNKCKSEQ